MENANIYFKNNTNSVNLGLCMFYTEAVVA